MVTDIEVEPGQVWSFNNAESELILKTTVEIKDVSNGRVKWHFKDQFYLENEFDTDYSLLKHDLNKNFTLEQPELFVDIYEEWNKEMNQ